MDTNLHVNCRSMPDAATRTSPDAARALPEIQTKVEKPGSEAVLFVGQ